MIATLCLALIAQTPQDAPGVDAGGIAAAARLEGLTFSAKELELMVRGAARNLRSYEGLRSEEIANSVPPALVFHPLLAGMELRARELSELKLDLPAPRRPENLEELAFADIRTLAGLILAREVSCVELAEMFLARLARLDAKLHCVITFTRERALNQARQLDAELAIGRWRGPLHGIPWGAKDLLAVKGYRTTWGAKPFEQQKLASDATVVARLDAAGAVLIAKLSMGALAMGDVWFGAKTRNPWNPEQGSSGSSAGPAAATAAGGVVFALGTETLGSIISPSARCGCTSLRPTFGRVSRQGAMALSWSMDKIGPLCRSFDDAAIVFAAIQGPDGRDDSVQAQPFAVPAHLPVKGWRVGYLKSAFERSKSDSKVLDELRALGVELVPVELPDFPVNAMRIILNAEAACAFDELTRDGRDDLLVRQDAGAWPNIFRVARLIPAVEYLRANRLRTLMMRALDERMKGIAALVHPSFAGSALTFFNLSGHPTAVAPSGFRTNGTPRSICFTGQLFGEAELLALAGAWQRAGAYHRRHPKAK